MVSNLLERRNKTWTIRTQVASDLTVRIGTSTFHLHKLPMLSRSGYISRLVFRNRQHDNLNIQIDNFPGGPKTFETVVKFCYGNPIDLTASNIASLYCAAHFLEMTDEYLVSNLVSRTEVFLSFLVLTSWKDTCQVLKGCETLSPWATELKIVKRCSEAIAARTHDGSMTWCYEDDVFLCLRIDHFIEVVGAVKLKGTTSSKVVGDCIASWTRKWLQRVKLLDKKVEASHTLTYQLQRVTIESLIRLLPLENDSVSCNFLLKLLRLSITMEADPDLVRRIELRITSMLDRCRVVDLLVETDDSGYDYDIIVRVVKSYVLLKSGHNKMHDVGRLMDGFMVFVAREKGVGIEGFRLLVDSLPPTGRVCDDGLYRAIDMYLKAHPQVTEEERTHLCKALNYHKLSNKARDHAMKNDRLPLTMTTRFILLEQVNFTKSVTTGTRSSLERTRTQMVINSGHNYKKNESGRDSWSDSRKEMIKVMREEVDLVKSQLRKLQMFKMEIQGQIMVKTRVK